MTSATIEAPGRGPYSGRPVVRYQGTSDYALAAKVRAVYEAVERVYRVEKGQLKRPTRGRSRVAFARQVAMYLAHVTFGLTLTTVGREFGRDRTTVAHACALVEDARDNPEFDRTLEILEAIAKHLVSAESARSPLPAE
jgi:chromosomal replication initiation ATPase DnaA